MPDASPTSRVSNNALDAEPWPRTDSPEPAREVLSRGIGIFFDPDAGLPALPDRAEPNLLADPAEPAEPVRPSEPTEPAELAEPALAYYY